MATQKQNPNPSLKRKVAKVVPSQFNKRQKVRLTDTWLSRQESADLLGVSVVLFDRDIRRNIGPEDVQDNPLRFRAGGVVAARMAQSQPRPATDADPLLAGGDSPGLERYRNAKADLAEFERDKQRGELVPLDELEASLATFFTAMRGVGERLQREFGNGASDVLNEGIGEWHANCEKLIENYRAKKRAGMNDNPTAGSSGKE